MYKRQDNERVLDWDTDYLVKITALADGIMVSVGVAMYEDCEDEKAVVLS